MSSDDAMFDQASEALFRLGRTFARLGNGVGRGDGDSPTQARTQLCLAIADGPRDGKETTIGVIATALGIEASTASRIVARAIDAGLVLGTPSSRDRRRTILALTPDGEDLVRAARAWQRHVFDDLTEWWDPMDRQTFALLFTSLSQDVVRRVEAGQITSGRRNAIGESYPGTGRSGDG